MSALESLAVGVALLAAIFDLRSGRIPNLLTLGGALGGLVAFTALDGLDGTRSSVAGWGLAMMMWLPIYALGGMGAGDVKLIAAMGACLGPSTVFYASLYTAIAGAAIAAALVIARGCALQTYGNIRLLLTHWRVAGFGPYAQLTLESATSSRLAYAVPIFIGTAVVLWLD